MPYDNPAFDPIFIPTFDPNSDTARYQPLVDALRVRNITPVDNESLKQSFLLAGVNHYPFFAPESGFEFERSGIRHTYPGGTKHVVERTGAFARDRGIHAAILAFSNYRGGTVESRHRSDAP